MNIVKMKIQDYDEVFALWKKTKSMGLHNDVDSKKGILRYLKRNPGMSLVARENGKLVGAVLCGNDGRRGYLFHLAIDKACQKQGVGKTMVNRALSKLASIGITMCLMFVFGKNRTGRKFWTHIGWTERPDIIMMVKNTGKQTAGKNH
jgi:ribosomal protein S18 acetylase RimI-like enzyme